MPPRRGRWCNRCCPGTPLQPPRTDRRNSPCQTARMPHSRPLTKLTAEALGQVCVDFARPPYTSLVQKRHHHSLASVRPLELQACCPVIEEQATAAQLWWQGRHGILYRLAPFGRGPRGAVARNDVMLRAVPDLACRCSGIRFRPRSVYSKEATQSLAPLLLRPLTMF